MRQLRGNRCLRFVISGKKENAGQKQSKQKTSRCVRLLSWGQRSVRGGGGKKRNKGACGCVHRTYMYFYCSIYFKNTLLQCDTKMIFLTDTILQRMFAPLDPRRFKDSDNLCPF